MTLQLSPFYWDLRNQLTRPWESVGQLVTKYFWRRWQPVLGPEYTVLIIQLRLLAADSNDPTQKVVSVSHKELAELTGLSLRKMQRLLSPEALRKPENWFLGRFLRIENRYAYDPRLGKKVRVANAYAVAIDDPIHPDEEDTINAEVLKREQADLRAQGLDNQLPTPQLADALPSTLPPSSGEEEQVIQLARELVPDLSLTVLGRLLQSVGPEVVRRQLEWFPARNNSWARKGDAAAFYTYCKDDRPAPQPIQRAAQNQRLADIHRVEEEEASRDALQETQSLDEQPEVWRELISRLPKVTRLGLAPRLTFVGIEGDTVVCRCPTTGDAFLLRNNQETWNSAATGLLGRPMTVRVESDRAPETRETTCTP